MRRIVTTKKERLDVPKKFCPRGQHWVPITDWHKRSAASDGLQGYCATCNIEVQYEPGGAAYKRK